MSQKYESLRTDEKFEDVSVGHKRSSSPDSLASTLLEEHDEISRTAPRWKDVKWFYIGNAAFFFLSCSLFISTIFIRTSTLSHVKRFSAYSPAAEAVKYEKVRFTDTMGENSPYVGYGAEVDKAWNAVSYDIGDQVITNEERKILGMPESHLKATNPKTGVEGYRVGLEVFHQLHCINLLRQVTYRPHYEKWAGNFADGDKELQIHTDHCLEILRLNTMCNADIGVFTFYLLGNDPLPWPELNSNHMCRNFDKVREWALDNSVGNMERPDIHDDKPQDAPHHN